MPAIGEDISNRAAQESLEYMINQARNEALADASVLFSGQLDRLATDLAIRKLSAVEIINLLRQLAEKWKNRSWTYDN